LKTTRRTFVSAAGAGTVATLVGRGAVSAQPLPSERRRASYDVVVVGAGVFGAWTAYHLQRSGRSVLLVDQYGPGNSRASSGGESRVIRMGYGADELYTRWSMGSLEQWQALFAEIGQTLFYPTGVLWMAHGQDAYSLQSLEVIARLGVKHERLDAQVLASRYPQIDVTGIDWAILEPESGVLLARRAVAAVAQQAFRSGAEYLAGHVAEPKGSGRLTSITTQSGETVSAGTFVFACGPWLGKVFPALLAERIFATRQEVYFFGVPPGDRGFSYPQMPTWVDFGDEMYGLPDIESRGFKIALDAHGEPIDPDAAQRTPTPALVQRVRDFVARRFPTLADAPVVETRVCQYENTSSGDFLIDRHPELENVWLVGGGSGHGFKHGPALGEYTAARIQDGGAVEERFTLAKKEKVQKRSVF
jgi:sarcosine oxidase